MFFRKKKEAKTVESYEHVTAILEAGCEFEGKLSFQGTARIAGKFKGEILASDTLIVGEGARIIANIEVNSIIITGEVVGDVVAKEKVEIYAPAIFKGNIKTPSLYIEEGVHYEGSTKMEKQKEPHLLADDGKAIPRTTAKTA
ncbi:MAG: polymer-forming cytoskeletal protein [Deltaproteobacteria bacterium]|nr:polymer-forming cytoskeletal protein [Deltaproteobacteria bacterium]